jgi:hypothetical protein
MSEQRLDPLFMNIGGPFCPKPVFNCQLHQNVPSWRWRQYIGIQQGGELAHASRISCPVPEPPPLVGQAPLPVVRR